MNGTLKDKESHPSAKYALEYLVEILSDPKKLFTIQESLASCAIENNRMAEICSETLDRLLNSQTVSDRYLLGLAWMIRDMEDNQKGK